MRKFLLTRSIISTAAALSVSFASASLSFADNFAVRWASPERQAVVASWTPAADAIDECIGGGLIYGVRYELSVCRRRLFWADDCQSHRLDLKLSQNPISDVVELQHDLLDDTKEPAAQEFDTVQSGVGAMSSYEFVLPPSQLAAKRDGLLLKARVRGSCRGMERSFLARIPSLLTLGLFSGGISRGNFDSGWQEFSLNIN